MRRWRRQSLELHNPRKKKGLDCGFLNREIQRFSPDLFAEGKAVTICHRAVVVPHRHCRYWRRKLETKRMLLKSTNCEEEDDPDVSRSKSSSG